MIQSINASHIFLPSLGKLFQRVVILLGGVIFHKKIFGFTVGKSTVNADITASKTVPLSESQYVLGNFLYISGSFDNP